MNPFRDAGARRTVKAVALPVEHGGYGILLEAVLVGLGLAPSLSGFFFAISFLGAFFIAQPLKVLLSEKVPLGSSPRRRTALGVLAVYGSAGGACFLAGMIRSDETVLPAILILIPFMLYQIAALLGRRGREFLTTASGSLLLNAAVLFILAGGGQSLTTALAVWILLGARVLSAVSYVRFRIRAARGDGSGFAPAARVHAVSALAVLLLAAAGLVPLLSASGYFIVAGHNALAVRRASEPVRPQKIGFEQLRLSLLNAFLIIAGFQL